MQTRLPDQDVVLLGVGHTNAHVLRMWRMRPIPSASLICVSNFPVATYSGMLPGVLAGQYPPERMAIDLVRLCAAAGARLIIGTVTGLDVPGRTLVLEDRPPIPFDVLSIGIGSVPRQEGVAFEGNTMLAVKPMQTLLPRLEARLRSVESRLDGRALNVVIVGGGAGGVEVALCLPSAIETVLGNVPVQIAVVESDRELVRGMGDNTARLVGRLLEQRGCRINLGRRVVRVDGESATLDDGVRLPADLVLWATSAAPPPLLESFDLPKDDNGFLLTRPTLQTVADAPVFAAGDAGTIEGACLPKAGVYAVREGPVLWDNISRLLSGRDLRPYEPQRGFLKLLNTGDGRAIAVYKGKTFRGRWCWALKNFVDGRFMDKYQDYRPVDMRQEDSPAAGNHMRCAGCGGKVSGSVLSRALARLEISPSEHVLLGLSTPDDAAIIKPAGGRPITVTADFFAAPLDDPYVVGRIAALNAASDAFALGSRPLAALALVTIPPGRPRQQEQLLYEILSGSVREFRRMNVTLAGGHTLEGPALTVGFTILADTGSGPAHLKGDLRVGDVLVLTKPLGTGILLAGHMRARCRAEWMAPLVHTMLDSNQPAAALFDEFGASGVTDVTGFGFAGHLLEMLRAGDKGAVVQLDAIPLLPGVAELIADGIESTLAPANRGAETEMDVANGLRVTPQYAALFDPQTSGGLLFGIRESEVEAVRSRLRDCGDVPSAVVGTVVETRADCARIQIR